VYNLKKIHHKRYRGVFNKDYRKDAKYAKGAKKRIRIIYFYNNYYLFALLCVFSAFAKYTDLFSVPLYLCGEKNEVIFD